MNWWCVGTAWGMVTICILIVVIIVCKGTKEMD